MKKIMKAFTFWFVFWGVAVIILNVLNLDDMNILMIGLNPILNFFSSSGYCEDISSTPYLWHILSLITMSIYGFTLDGIRFLAKVGRGKI